uniref:MARVEL domain-containing protein n=1 Tax=Echeneis naucrates TaxID=173247 RepID=A0A665V6F9_ECHNA
MADFPSKVTTETSSPNSQQGGNSLRGLTANVTTMIDISFIRSIPAILMIAEIVMLYNATATVLYLTAFLTNAASVHPFSHNYYYGHFAAAAFFGALVTVAYGVSAFFSYLDWRGDGGNAATNTVQMGYWFRF